MTTTSQKTREAAKPPIARLTNGLLSASIWQQESKSGPFYTVTFERRYQNSQGEWHSTHSYSRNDLLKLAELADSANIEILNLYSQTD